MLDSQINIPKLSNILVLNKDVAKSLDNRSEELTEQAQKVLLTSDHGFEIAKNVFEASKAINSNTTGSLKVLVDNNLYEIKFNFDAIKQLKQIKERLSSLSSFYKRQADSKLQTKDDRKNQITLGKIDGQHKVYLSTNGKLNTNAGRPYANDLLRLSYDGSNVTELMFGSINKACQLHNRHQSKCFFVKPLSSQMTYGAFKDNKKEGAFLFQDASGNLSLINYQNDKQSGSKITLTSNDLLILEKPDSDEHKIIFANSDIFQGKLNEEGQPGQGALVTKNGIVLVGDFSQDQNEIHSLKSSNFVEHGKFDSELHLTGPGTKIFPANNQTAYAAQIEADWGDIYAAQLDAKVRYANGLEYQGKLVVEPDSESIVFDDAYLIGDVIPQGKAKLSLVQGEKTVFACDAEYDPQGILDSAQGQIDYKGSLHDFRIQDGQLQPGLKLDFKNVDISKIHVADLYSKINSAIIHDFIEEADGTRIYRNGLKLKAEAGWQNDQPGDGSLKIYSLAAPETELKIENGQIANQAKVTRLRLANGDFYSGSVKISSAVDDQCAPSFEELLAKKFKLIPNGEGELAKKDYKIKSTWDNLKPSGELVLLSKKGTLAAMMENGKVKEGLVDVVDWHMHDGKYSGYAKISPDTDFIAQKPKIIPHDSDARFHIKKVVFIGVWENAEFLKGVILDDPKDNAFDLIDSTLTISGTDVSMPFKNAKIEEISKHFRSARKQLEKRFNAEITLAAKNAVSTKANAKTPVNRFQSFAKPQQDNSLRTMESLIDAMSGLLSQHGAAVDELSDSYAVYSTLNQEGNIDKIIELIHGKHHTYEFESSRLLQGLSVESLIDQSTWVFQERALSKAIQALHANPDDYHAVVEHNLESFINDGDLFFRKLYIPNDKLPNGINPSVKDLPDMDDIFVQTVKFNRGLIVNNEELLKAVLNNPFSPEHPKINYQGKMTAYRGPIINGKPDTSKLRSATKTMTNMQATTNYKGELDPVYRVSAFKNGMEHGRVIALFQANHIKSLVKSSFAIEANANYGVYEPKIRCYFGPEAAFELTLKEKS